MVHDGSVGEVVFNCFLGRHFVPQKIITTFIVTFASSLLSKKWGRGAS